MKNPADPAPNSEEETMKKRIGTKYDKYRENMPQNSEEEKAYREKMKKEYEEFEKKQNEDF